ncbi:hypothetical protein [Paenibacillus pini]|uniref:Uncharacterized protein n=1 Tax=Paenibacillus pini JCM 16418 TaxID=1236976 RepID=W7YEH7_9BACL|nr:hypothetical protein [Paenibacillus pini]GAF06902.1 hypothetical protein JCM16418_886 [Paenibacillus pini JCM 16418]
MKGTWVKVIVPAFCIAMTLSACTGMQQQRQKAQSVRMQSQTVQPYGEHHQLNSIDVIPRIDGDKVYTTNRKGTTYSGMGSQLYSHIGTSSIHNSGGASTIESKLNAAGLSGVTILVLGDSVYVGDPNQQTHIQNSKPQQSKILSPNEGLSGKGYMSSKGSGPAIGTRNINESNSSLTHQEIKELYGEHVQIYTVHNKQAIAAMNRVKTSLKSGASKNTLSKDIALILKHADKETSK